MVLGIFLAIFTFWIVSRSHRWESYKTWERIYLIVMLVSNLVVGGYQVLYEPTRAPEQVVWGPTDAEGWRSISIDGRTFRVREQEDHEGQRRYTPGGRKIIE